jgi:hypothetical protein
MQPVALFWSFELLFALIFVAFPPIRDYEHVTEAPEKQGVKILHFGAI